MIIGIVCAVVYLLVGLLAGMRHYQVKMRNSRHNNMADLESMFVGALWPIFLIGGILLWIWSGLMKISRIGLK